VEPFTEKEIHEALLQTSPDKASGPDGFTGAFFRSCWAIVKGDLMATMNSIHDARCVNLDLLNSANVILIPKKEGAEHITDYRPISLIHSVAKLLTKVLALGLGPAMKEIISKSQSAFIRGCSIHDNFQYVRTLARRSHRNRTPMLLIKLDISKAFDLVRWDYLLSLLQHIGFPAKLRDWIAAILSTSSSQILLNGIQGQHIRHGRGLRQGDPLSPLLFILDIDPLQRLLNLATEAGILSKVGRNRTRLSTSMYADDAVIFLRPIKEEVATLKHLLQIFGEVTSLRTNIHKSSVAPIRCENLDLDDILYDFPAQRTSFPIKYLGLPLAI
jgi:hypothetical protein